MEKETTLIALREAAMRSIILLTPEELSNRIRTPEGTLQNWRVQRNAGKPAGPPFIKLGLPGERKSAVRYRLVDVEEWIAQLGGGGDVPEQAVPAPIAAGTSQRDVDEPVSPPAAQKPLLTPQELSERTGVALQYLQNWRVQRNAGEEIGPRFIKIGDGRKSPVRYLLADVKAWESSARGRREMEHPAASVVPWRN